MPRFHITGQINRDLSNDEVNALPDGWARNEHQHNYVQAYDIDAEHIGYALGCFYKQIVEASRGEPALRPVSTSVREAPA